MAKPTRAERRREARARKNRSPEQQADVDRRAEEKKADDRAKIEARQKIVVVGKSKRGLLKVSEIPDCVVPGCVSKASTTRGLCRDHEERFHYIYWLFTADKSSGLIVPGEQQGKPMTNFDKLIKGEL